jgi:hypothetical protein
VNPYDCGCFSTTGGWDFLVGYAFFDAVREQIRVTYKGFYVGVFQNSQNESSTADVLLPMVAVGYTYGNPGTPMEFGVHGLFQTYKNDNPGTYVTDDNNTYDTADDTTTWVENALYGESYSSYGVVAKFGMNMAPFSFYISPLYGVNAGNMGFPSLGMALEVGDEIKDTTAIAAHGAVTYTTGAIRVSVGAGYRQVEYDIDGSDPDKQMSYYASLKYSIQPNFSVTPIVLIEDKMKDSAKVKEGKRTLFGALFEANI